MGWIGGVGKRIIKTERKVFGLSPARTQRGQGRSRFRLEDLKLSHGHVRLEVATGYLGSPRGCTDSDVAS